MIDGVMLIDKEKGKNSQQVVNEIKKKFNFKKVGHAGTLDPLATGLLVVLINSATKISDYLLTADKYYEVEMKLFEKTDNGDITGNVIETCNHQKFSKKEINEVFDHFNGFMYDQYPPIYSAIKVNGKKMYQYARNNETVEIKPRTVSIKAIKLNKYDAEKSMIKFTVHCSKGTYVRSLVEDMASKLNTVATVNNLKRIQSGNFLLKNAFKIEQANEKGIISMYDALFINNHPMMVYHNEAEIKQGKPVVIIKHTDPIIFLINKKHDVLAIYRHVANHVFSCQRGL